MDQGSTTQPFFGWFCCDNYDALVKKSMGNPKHDPIVIPAILMDGTMPVVAMGFHTVPSSLLRVCNACSLLMHQRQLVMNTLVLVASAAQYAFTVMLPMPDLDPEHCFWCKSPMRREIQINLLFLL
eukprot:5592378-Ditylum_brightwellii.AAC.1